MSFLNLLIPEKHVAGIEISDSVIRIAFLRARKKTRTRTKISASHAPTRERKEVTPGQELPSAGTFDGEQYELILVEEPITANIIENGIVRDHDLLTKTLTAIWAKENLGTDYAIVSIPPDTIYTRTFSFPKTVLSDQLDGAMRLALSFQLPIKTETAYLDWERITAATPSSSNEILFAMIPRSVVEGYMKALAGAGIKPLAIESHLASAARGVEVGSNTTLFTEKTPDGAIVFTLKDGLVRFSRTLPAAFVPEHDIAHEIEKIKTALSAETKEPVTLGDLYSIPLKDYYHSLPTVTEPKAKWSIVLGALERGRIPEGCDNLISLLPVGTEEAYAFQKKTTFAALLRNITIGVSVFFVVAFLVVYLFISSLAQRSSQAITATISGTPPQFAEKEAQIENLNALTDTAEKIFIEAPRWSMVISELQTLIISGITISNFSAGDITGNLSFIGTARDRATLNQFKRSLQGSSFLTAVDIPITNLELKESIPFSATFRIKDPRAVYYYNK